MDQSEIMHLLRRQVSAMEGGKRRVGRPRKKGRGMELADLMVEGGRRRGRGLDEMFATGGALVGGKKKMPPALRAYWESKRKKKRGRGLVGGITAQDMYDRAVVSGTTLKKTDLDYLKAGIVPKPPKEILASQIQHWEEKIGLKKTSKEALMKYTIENLRKILTLYIQYRKVLAYPPSKEAIDEYDEERFEMDPNYVSSPEAGFADWNDLFDPTKLPK